MRCATHTFSLVYTIDAKQVTKNSQGKVLSFVECIKKTQDSRAPIRGDKEQLKTPCPTCWNALYDSLNQLSHLRDKLPEMMAQLQLPAFKEVELDYLGEYCKILRPIAVAVGQLQGQISCNYGELLPTLFAVQSKLHDLQTSNLRYTTPLLQAILGGFEKRFCSYLELKKDVNEAILATVTHPFFKMHWIPPTTVRRKKANSPAHTSLSWRAWPGGRE